MGLKSCKNGHLFSEKKHGKICPYCNISLDSDRRGIGEDPLGQYSEIYIDDLEIKKKVVGWLVCVRGPSKGKDYRIVTERNFLGSSHDMDIRIVGDKSIEPRCHAIITHYTYENQPDQVSVNVGGESRGSVRIQNDEDTWVAVEKPTPLLAGSRLKIGDSEFIFIPLCGDNDGVTFSWQEVEND